MEDKLRQIKLIAMDVDGVLTQGEIIYSSSGEEIKSFCIKDGPALKAARIAGLHVAVITGRKSAALERRMKELRIENLEMACRDKGASIRSLLDRLGLRRDEAAFIGDDLIDIPAFRECGFNIAVGDACEDLKAMADHVTRAHGGRGAVREAIETILKAQDKWASAVDALVNNYQRPVEAHAEPDNPAHQ